MVCKQQGSRPSSFLTCFYGICKRYRNEFVRRLLLPSLLMYTKMETFLRSKNQRFETFTL